MKKYCVLLVLLVSCVGFAQNLNDYKYVQVPEKFSFLKEVNQYNLNLISKLLLQKYGFEAYIEKEVAPDDFINQNCNKLYFDLIENNTMFITKVKIVLKDCKGVILFTSEEGTSKDKEYKVAYNQALRMAFDTFNILKTHKYQPSQKSLGMIGEPAKTEITPVKVDVVEKEFNPKTEAAQSQMFYKKYNVVATETGYNLITVSSEYKIFQIFKTTSNDIFIAKRDSISGILIKKNDSWFFEYYHNDTLVSEKVEVKF